MAKKNIQIPSLSEFTKIDVNARNTQSQSRDKSHDVPYVIAMSGGNAGAVCVTNPDVVQAYQTDDQQMSVMELLASLVDRRANAEDTNPTTIYVPVDAHIRAKGVFGAIKNGTEPVSEKALAYISKFRSEEYTARYMQAVNKLMAGIQKARDAKKLIVIRELDQFQFTVVNGVIGLDDNQTFLLSGLEVEFTASKENGDLGIACIPKGTIVGKTNPMKLGNNVYICAEKTYGIHTLTVHNVHGDRKNRKLVAKINGEQHPEYIAAQKAYFSLLNKLNPKAAEEEAKDMDIKLEDFNKIETESEIPA